VIKQFKTSTGEIVKGERLIKALNAVADQWAQLGHDIRKEDLYAIHVAEQAKEDALQKMLDQAEEIRAGKITNLTFAQKLNYELCGECPALLP